MSRVASPSKLRRYWVPLRFVVGLALAGVAIWVVQGKSSELNGAAAFLARPHWGWLILAAAAELASFVSLATLQRILMSAGGLVRPLRRMTAITFATNSVQSALPVGAAFAGVYQFRQYEFLGADEVLAGWVVIASGALAFAAIAGLACIAFALAASTGSTFDLYEAIALVVVVAALVVIAWSSRARLYGPAVKAVVMMERRLHRQAGQWTGPLRAGLERMRAVAPSRRAWAWAWVAGVVDWLADCSCLAFAFLAVGAGVPWRGLLLAYCGGQLAILLPITPGGLGVVEGSLTLALVDFGGGRATTVAAVLLYRLLSFWVPLPTGACCYLGLAGGRRRSLRREAARAAAPASRGSPAPDRAPSSSALAFPDTPQTDTTAQEAEDP
jgi:hypothetical protein